MAIMFTLQIRTFFLSHCFYAAEFCHQLCCPVSRSLTLHSSMVDLGWAPDHLHTVTSLYYTAPVHTELLAFLWGFAQQSVVISTLSGWPFNTQDHAVLPLRIIVGDFPGGLVVDSTSSAGGTDSIPGWGAKDPVFHLAQPKINKIK